MRKGKIVQKYNLKKALLLILLLVAFLIMSTYAWFTSNKLVKVGSIDVSIQASEGFQISLDGVNWKSVINSADITGNTVMNSYPNNVNHVPEQMVPVSSAGKTVGEDGNKSGFMEMYLGEVTTDDVTGEYVLSAKPEEEVQNKGGNFVAYDLFFKTNNKIDLLLEQEAGVTDIGPGTRKNKGIENAARIAFVNQGFIAADTSYTGSALTNAVQSLAYTDTTDGSNIKIWEPNYDAHTELAKIEAYNMFGKTFTGGTDLSSHATTPWPGSVDHAEEPTDGISDEIITPIELTKANAAQNPSYFETIGKSDSKKYVRTPRTRTAATATEIELNAGITKMRIYMWLEGQDYDCGDSASGSNIKWDLILTATKVEEPITPEP